MSDGYEYYMNGVKLADPPKGLTVCICGDYSKVPRFAPEVMQAIADLKREQNIALIDNPWHGELRERYELKPKMAAWKCILLMIVYLFTTNSLIDLYRHLQPRAYVINLLVSAIVAPVWYFVVFSLPSKFSRSAKAA